MVKRSGVLPYFILKIAFLFFLGVLGLSGFLSLARQQESGAYRIAYREYIHQGTNSQQVRLSTMFPDGSNQRVMQIFREDLVGNSQQMQWTSDTEALLYVKKWQNELSIFQLNITDFSEELLVQNGDNPAPSLDGRFLAYEQDNQIKVIDYASGAEVFSTQLGVAGSYHLPTWTSDSKTLYFSDSTNNHLFEFNLQTQQVTEIVIESVPSGDYKFANMVWSPTSEWLAILIQYNRSPATQIMYWREDEQFTRLFQGQYSGITRLNWSPDGRWFSYPTRRTLVVDEVGTRELQNLPVGSHTHSGVQWSPDGRWFYFVQQDKQGWQIYRQNVDDQTTEQVTTRPTSQFFPTISPLIDLPWHSRSLMAISSLVLIGISAWLWRRWCAAERF